MKTVSMLIHFLSGEFLLKQFPNGGTIVFLRSIITSIFLFGFVVVSMGILKTGFGPSVRWDVVIKVIIAKYEIGCAIFAGCYTVFYTRFSSQWSYLAGVYNQLLNAIVQIGPNPSDEQKEALLLWKAGILEDAYILHLAAKPMFAPFVKYYLEDPEVVRRFRESSLNSETILDNLKRVISKRHKININIPPKESV